jgi:hypothetical protein
VFKASTGCPLVGQNENKEEQKCEVNGYLSIANVCTKICLSLMVIGQPNIHHSYFGPNKKIKMFLRLGEMFFYIVTFPRRLVVHMD